MWFLLWGDVLPYTQGSVMSTLHGRGGMRDCRGSCLFVLLEWSCLMSPTQ